jgi:iron complex outermembrane receptor protein
VGTADLEFQHRLKAATSHDLLWGVGFRQVRDRVGPALASWFTPERFTARTYNAFLHDEATWRDKTIRVTAGSKLEWNAFSGFEIQPNVRVLWAPTPVHSVWTAASRAVRAPSRYEVHQVSIEDVEEQDGDVVYSLFVPPAAFRSETVTAYEAGYRFVPTRRLSLDVSSFYNVYDHLQTVETGTQQRSALPIAGLMTPLGRTNAGSGRVSGAEVLAYWTISGALQVSGSYTALHMRMDRTGLPHNEHGDRVEDQYAANMFFVRAYANLPYAVELNSDLRFVGRVRGEGVPAYFEGSVHVSREVLRGLRVTGSVDNILHRRHGEWDEGELTVPRGLRIGLDWRF